MRRVLILLLCCVCLVSSVRAVSGITSADSQTTVAADGTCQVSLNVTLQLDTAVSNLTFPLPEKAKDITLNQSPATTVGFGPKRNVDLSGVVSAAGVYTLSFRYSLPDAIVAGKEGDLSLVLELLSGFSYPIRSVSFSVTLPGDIENTPSFSSTYHQDAANTMVQVSSQGNVLSGTVTEGLKDSEVLTMTLPVSRQMFPQNVVKQWSMDTVDFLMLLFAGFAAIYWLFMLRCAPVKKIRYTAPPQGFTPGELGCHLTGVGVDFSLMVLYWAQLGYLLIDIKDNGKILLHKRMHMGNERSNFEIKYFKKLFGRRRVVDGNGTHYTRLCREAGGCTPYVGTNFLRSSGSLVFFRCVCAVIGGLGGVSLAMAFVNDTVWQVVLSILLCPVGLICAWQIQSAAKVVHLRSRYPLWMGLGWCGVWLLLGIFSGEANVSIFVILAQLLAGFAAAYGGRRNEIGKQTMSEILGYRRYLKSVSLAELQTIMRSNPDYFHQTIPWALALGVDRSFARQFGKSRLPQCSYLSTTKNNLSAQEWNETLRNALRTLDAQQRQLPLDNLFGKK